MSALATVHCFAQGLSRWHHHSPLTQAPNLRVIFISSFSPHSISNSSANFVFFILQIFPENTKFILSLLPTRMNKVTISSPSASTLAPYSQSAAFKTNCSCQLLIQNPAMTLPTNTTIQSLTMWCVSLLSLKTHLLTLFSQIPTSCLTG